MPNVKTPREELPSPQSPSSESGSESARPIPTLPASQSAKFSKPSSGQTFDVVKMWMKGQTNSARGHYDPSPRRTCSSVRSFTPQGSSFVGSARQPQYDAYNHGAQGPLNNDSQSLLQESLRASQWNTELILEDRRLTRERMAGFESKQQESIDSFLNEMSKQLADRGFEQGELLAKHRRDMERLLETINGHTERTVQQEVRTLRVWMSQNFQRLYESLRAGGGAQTFEIGRQSPRDLGRQSPRDFLANGTSMDHDTSGGESTKAIKNAPDTLPAFSELTHQMMSSASLICTPDAVQELTTKRPPNVSTGDGVPGANMTSCQSERATALARSMTASGASRVGAIFGLGNERNLLKEHVAMMSKVENMTNGRALKNTLRRLVGFKEQEDDAIGAVQRSRLIKMRTRHASENTWLAHVIDGIWFNGFFFLMICLNAAWIAHTTDLAVRGRMKVPPEDNPDFHRVLTQVFTWIFVLELVIRLSVLRMAFFSRDDWRWNMFDMLLVSVSLLEEVMSFASVTFLRVMRIFRLVRVVKLFKVLRWFSGLQLMLVALLSCLPVLVWTILTLIFIMFLFSVLILQGAVTFLDKHDGESWHILQENYHTVSQGMYTLLLAVTFGKNWVVMAAQLGRISELLRAIFILYIIIVLFGFYNIVIGVFVIKSSEVREQDGSLAVQKELEASNAFVVELTGLLAVHTETGSDFDRLTEQNYLTFLEDSEVQIFLQTHSIDVSEAQELFHIIDHTQSGYVTIEDFVYGCQRMKGVAKAMDVVLLFEEVVRIRNVLFENRDRQTAMVRDFKSWQNAFLVEVRNMSSALDTDLASQRRLNTELIP